MLYSCHLWREYSIEFELFVSKFVHGESFMVVSGWCLFPSRSGLYKSSFVVSAVFLAACNSPAKISSVPTPESADAHRVALAQIPQTSAVETIGEQSFVPAVAVNPVVAKPKQPVVQPAALKQAHLPAETSDKTKFSSAAYGVKGSPRVTTSRGVRKGGGRYQIGKPYTIRGIKYFPKLDPNLRQTGYASWYGPNFHGRLTANGEVYDQYALSAAHPTMPLPSYAKVTNLENGSSVTVRVNDRGPFSRKRIIDLSARAAQLLGYTKQGVAKVRVEYAGKAPLHGLDEKELIATYNPGRGDQRSIPALPGRDVASARQGKSVEIASNTTTNLPSASSGISAPRPSALVNSFAADVGSNAAVNAISSIQFENGTLQSPKTGMQDLVQLEFGPFSDLADLLKAEQLFENDGILQRIPSKKTDEMLLMLITARETSHFVLEEVVSAKIKLHNTK